jgi:hypothetical protein
MYCRAVCLINHENQGKHQINETNFKAIHLGAKEAARISDRYDN